MIAARREELIASPEIDRYFDYPDNRRRRSCTIFLGFTSNLISSGLRDVII